MISIVFDSKTFNKEMNNIVEYSIGYLEGINRGKPQFYNNLAKAIKESMESFIDSMARIDPESLHHVYEWGMRGTPEGRLFDIEYSVKGDGLSLRSQFRQSLSVSKNSNTPFYDKAKIMEEGIPVTIRPKKKVLVFQDENGETVFTKNPVVVDNPGGSAVQGSFEKVFRQYIEQYFSQVFLNTSGIAYELSRQDDYKKNLAKGKSLGRLAGISTGYKWITKAGDN